GLYRVGDDATLVEKRLQYGRSDGTNARGAAGIGGVEGRGLRIGLRQEIGAVFRFTAIEGFRFQEAIMQRVVADAIGEAMVRQPAVGFRSHSPVHEIFLLVDRADGVT